MRALCFVGLMAGMASIVVRAGPAVADCQVLRAAAESAREDQEPGMLRSLADQARADAGCTATVRRRLDALVAAATERTVVEALAAGAALEVYEPTLRQAQSYAARWRSLAWLGDLGRDRNRFDEALRDYQQALLLLADPVATPNPPGEVIITRIYRRAEQSRLLASAYLPLPDLAALLARVTPTAPPLRAATPGAPAAQTPPSTPRATVVPIEFQFNAIRFTAKGQAAVDDLLSRLKAERSPAITLIGHTDALGGAEYNLTLSRRRADAVRDYMLKAGYSGTIRSEGRGAQEPLKLDEPGRYSPAQIHQLNRRVEVRVAPPSSPVQAPLLHRP